MKEFRSSVSNASTPRPHQDFETGDHVNDEYHILCDALVRVRLIGEITLDKLMHRTFDKSNDSDHVFSFVVVDGDGEYSCKVLDVDRNYSCTRDQRKAISQYTLLSS